MQPSIKSVFDATDYSGSGKDLGLRCPKCKKAVEPHPEGKDPAHFEHINRNTKCPLSHPAPKKTKKRKANFHDDLPLQ